MAGEKLNPGRAAVKAHVATTPKFPETLHCCDNIIFMVLGRNKSDEYKRIGNP
jgi:hypothetical protein